MFRLLTIVSLALGGGLLVRGFVAEPIVIQSGSMEPTLPVGTRAVVNKLAYVLDAPKRGDIVSFHSPMEDKGLVKRVVAVGGDTIKIVHKRVVLNGQPLDEPYVKHTRADERLVGDDMDIGRVPEGYVVVMGDNRDESGDSRDWIGKATGSHIPFVPVKSLEGKVVFLS